MSLKYTSYWNVSDEYVRCVAGDKEERVKLKVYSLFN